MRCLMFSPKLALVIAAIIGVASAANGDGLIKLHIGGIFPMSAEGGGWAGGQACRPAAMLALDDVNQRKDLLPGYYLKMIHDDSQCQPGLGAKVMYDLLYTPPTKIMLLAGCSLVTTTVAEAAPLWNLIVLSYGGSSPALSDRERFSTLFRTHPSATIHNPTRVALFEHFQWRKIAILQSAEEVFISTAQDLELLCREHGIQTQRLNFLSDPADVVKNLKRQDARIIVGMFYEKEARRVICEAYKEGLYGAKYVWLLIGWYPEKWVVTEDETINCTRAQMEEAAQYHLTTEGLMWSEDDAKTIAGKPPKEFRRRLNESLNGKADEMDGFVESPLAYDAIWALALALNCSMNELAKKGMKLEDFQYDRRDIFQQIYDCMNKMHFSGISGTVAFGASGDRIALTQIEQMQDGVYKKVAVHDARSQRMLWHNGNKNIIKFAGDKPPPDSTKIVPEPVLVSVGLFWSLGVLAFIGIGLSIACIAFNFAYRGRRYIQQSQPASNNVMCIGFVLCCTAIFFVGSDTRYEMWRGSFDSLCQIRIWFLTIGFSLAYGSMFSKVWRAHRMSSQEAADQANDLSAQRKLNPLNPLALIGMRARSKERVVEKEVNVWKLQLLVVGFVLTDVLLLTCWALIDPLHKTVKKFDQISSDDREEDVRREPVLEHCECENRYVWIGIIFAYKGILLLLGLFLAYEIRNVKAKHLNDSRFVGMAIYNVVVLTLITGPVSLLIMAQTNASFAFIAVAILLCTFLSLALVFIPKVVYVRNVSGMLEARQYTDSRASKEDEERYKRLVGENEEIKRQIAQKEARVRELNAILQERIAAAAVAAASAAQVLSVSANEGANGESSNAVPRLAPPPAARERDEQREKAVTFSGEEASRDERAIVHRDAEDSGYRSSAKSVSLLEPLDTDVIL